MLSDPLVVPQVVTDIETEAGPGLMDYASVYSGAAHSVTLHTISDGEGTAKRKGTMSDGTKVLQTISHSTSKENAPYVTDRTMIRYDYSRNDIVTGKPVTCSAYVVIALPQGTTFTTDDARDFTLSLALFLLLGGARENAVGPRLNDAIAGDTLVRLLDGEA